MADRDSFELAAFDAATPERQLWSDRICTGLQLAEHWQDVAEDYARGRIYLPSEDRVRFACEEHELAVDLVGGNRASTG